MARTDPNRVMRFNPESHRCLRSRVDAWSALTTVNADYAKDSGSPFGSISVTSASRQLKFPGILSIIRAGVGRSTGSALDKALRDAPEMRISPIVMWAGAYVCGDFGGRVHWPIIISTPADLTHHHEGKRAHLDIEAISASCRNLAVGDRASKIWDNAALAKSKDAASLPRRRGVSGLTAPRGRVSPVLPHRDESVKNVVQRCVPGGQRSPKRRRLRWQHLGRFIYLADLGLTLTRALNPITRSKIVQRHPRVTEVIFGGRCLCRGLRRDVSLSDMMRRRQSIGLMEIPSTFIADAMGDLRRISGMTVTTVISPASVMTPTRRLKAYRYNMQLYGVRYSRRSEHARIAAPGVLLPRRNPRSDLIASGKEVVEVLTRSLRCLSRNTDATPEHQRVNRGPVAADKNAEGYRP